MASMQVKLRKAIGAVKDQTSISIAKVSSAGVPDLDVAVVKATSHEEAPLEEKHVQEVLYLTSCSGANVEACIAALAKRLSKTRNWIVAVKTLMLAHRLLRVGDPAIMHELTLSRRRGMRVLNVYDFRDESHANGWDFSAFVRAYGLYLDERLDCSVASLSPPKPEHEKNSAYSDPGYEHDDGHGHGYGSGRSEYDQDRSRNEVWQTQPKNKAVRDMQPDELMEKFPLFQRLLERVLVCRPTGAAKVNRLVLLALYPVVKESFLLYTDIRDGMAILLDAFFDMEQFDYIGAFEIYRRAAKQVDELISFYSFCKTLGVCGAMEYPAVERISEELFESMEASLRLRLDSVRDSSGRTKTPQLRSVSFQDEMREEASHEINGMKVLPAPLTGREAFSLRVSAPRDTVPVASTPVAKLRSVSFQDEMREEASYEIKGMKALPAPPLPAREAFSPRASAPRATVPVASTPVAKSANLPTQKNSSTSGELLNLDEPAMSSEEHENKLALALFSGTETRVNTTWETFSPSAAEHGQASIGGGQAMGVSNGAAGWELALIDSESDLSKPISNTLAGGFDRLLLDSLYDQGVDHRKMAAATAPTGSASSVAMPGHSQSNFLALPAPPAAGTALEEDPFAASVNVPPPAYVQMAEMRQKQQLLVQEQQHWLQYQQQGSLHGYNGPMNFASNRFATSFQPTAYPIHHYYSFNSFYR